MRAERLRPPRHVRGLVLAAALGLAACAPTALPSGPAAPVTPPPIVLNDGAVAALAELLRMEDVRRIDAPRLAVHAGNSLPFVRGRAALAAGRVRDRAATPLVLDLLNDADHGVRANAAFALGLLADSADTVVAALAELALHPAGGVAAVEAIGALGRIGTPAAFAAVDRIILLATDSAPAPPTRRGAAPAAASVPADRLAEALLAVWKFPRAGATVERVAALTASPDTAIRWRAAYALVRWGGPGSIAPLLDRLDDDDPLTRALAVRALRGPIADSAALRAPARDGLRRALDDSHPHVRINAVRALSSFSEPGVLPPIAALLADSDSNVVLTAVESLGTLGPAAAAALGSVVGNRSARPSLRAAALAPLIRAAPDAGLAAALAMSGDADPFARLYATRTLGGAPWDDVASRLRELTRDADPRVAAAAFTSIGALAPAGAARPLFTEGLTARSTAVRAAAIRALARTADVTDLPILLEAYAGAGRDAEPTAALAAVDALGALAARDVPVARTFFLRFQPAADAAVRRRVAQRLGAGDRPGWTVPDEPARPLAWYADVVRRHLAPVLAGAPAPRIAIEGPTGTIVIELDPVDAPLTVESFLALADRDYFDARDGRAPRWHRVVPNFVLQDGDPRGDGSGPGYTIRDEINRLRYGRGALGMALSGPDTGGSQFFITHAPQPHLDGGYTVFGRVIDGMDAADRVVQDEPLRAIRRLDR